jgi:hypothetical protein
MQHIQLNLTKRQAELVLEALREELITKNSLVEGNKNNSQLVIDLQSEAHVIRATIQAVKDELYKIHKDSNK